MSTYFDRVKSGDLTIEEATGMQEQRSRGQTFAKTLTTGRVAFPDAFAFGILDAICVRLVAWYGPSEAGKVLEHYAEVCARQSGAE